MVKKASETTEAQVAKGAESVAEEFAEKGESRSEQVQNLFLKATTDITQIKSVSSYIRTGRQWDLTHKEILGDVLVIHRIKEMTTKYGEAVLADADHEGQQKSILLGGQVLITQAKELSPHLPVLAVVRKPSRAYVLTDPTPGELAAYRDEYLS